MAGVQVRPVPEDERAQSRQASPGAANASPPLSHRAAALAGSPSRAATRTLFPPFLSLACIATADAHPTDDFDGDWSPPPI